MDPFNHVNVSLITSYGTYCSNVMPFRLKNACANYQRMVYFMFYNQIGWNMIYVDDMPVKSRRAMTHVLDLREIFVVLWKCRVKLNILKCVFEVWVGKLIGNIT